MAGEGRLYWFDIQGRRLRWLRHATGERGEVALPMRASAAAPRARGGLLMATERGLAAFDPNSLEVTVVTPMAFPPGFRTNDGKVAPDGRFWWSSMDDAAGARPGAVFVTDADLGARQVLNDVHIANAICASPGGATLYLADSRRQTIWACDPDAPACRRVFARTEGEIYPDGAAMDVEGFLWNAQWGGSRIVRYAPDGRIDRIVRLPVSQPTSCAFGGSDLSTLYVTSAWDGLDSPARAREPLAGALFAFEPGVAGAPLPAFPG